MYKNPCDGQKIARLSKTMVLVELARLYFVPTRKEHPPYGRPSGR